MKARAYYDNPREMIVRIFQSRGSYAIAHLPMNAATPDAADHALKQMRLRRKGRWREMPWGREARVYFANREVNNSSRTNT